MRVLVAGATGVIGRQLLPLLSATGYEVIALARKPANLGPEVTTVAADAFDKRKLMSAVRDVRPDAVIHAMTAIPAEMNPRKIERDLHATNRLRTEGARNLIDAAVEAGVSRIISQGLAYAYDPHGDGPADEDTPFWRDPPKPWVESRDALRTLEHYTSQVNGLMLRFGHLYGPGTAFAADGSMIRQIAAGKLPIVGGGTATFSFTHTHDAATAIIAALSRPVTGALNVVDDEPAQVRQWLPEIATLLGARRPKNIPATLGRLAAGPWGVAFFTKLRGADNARARLTLDWRPRYTSWQQGFAEELRGADIVGGMEKTT